MTIEFFWEVLLFVDKEFQKLKCLLLKITSVLQWLSLDPFVKLFFMKV